MADDTPAPPSDDPVSPSHAGPEHAEPAAFAREFWNTRIGFVLAAVGSAVGLGNMWRFPYVTAESGGAAFVLLYILLTFVLGIPVMLAEFVVGRRTHQSPIGALRQAGGGPWSAMGYMFVAAGFLILAYYAVIAGWVARYALSILFTGFPADAATYFGEISFGGGAIAFHVLFMAMTIGIVMGGVEKGIERAATVMMPTLFILLAGLAIWALTLPGSDVGYAYYLAPSLEDFSLEVFGLAAAQAFFSLSLGMGAMLTFASYLSRKESLPRESVVIAFSDFGVAFVAGLVVFPVIFALGLQGSIGESTFGALFISLPSAFAAMGGAVGRVVGTLFFLALLVGALTSTISLLEVVAASMIDEFNWSRKKAALLMGSIIAFFGLWPALSEGALTVYDAVTGNVMLPLGGLGLALLVGWRMKDPITELTRGTGPTITSIATGWLWTMRIIVPILLIFVLSTTIPSALRAIGALFGG